MSTFFGIALVATLALAARPSGAGQSAQPAPTATVAAISETEIVRAQKPGYPLAVCVVSGEKLGTSAVDAVVDGRLVRLCCGDCKAGVEKDKAAIFARIDAGVVAAQKKDYPLATCPVSGEKLGEKSIDVVRGTKLVRLCCDGCVKGLDKDLAAATSKVDKAWIEAQRPSYPLDTCVVSDEKLGSMGDPVDVLYGTKLVRLCCKGCTKALDKEGPALIAKIEAARAKAPAPR